MPDPSLASFSVDRARDLGGPEWLVRRRVEAAEALADSALPTTDEEDWRYSRIGELDLDRFRVAGAPPAPEVAAPRVDGLTVGAAGDEDDDLVATVCPAAPDHFELFNRAASVEPLVIRVADGVRVAEPVVVTHHIAADGSAVFPRIVVDVGRDAALTLVHVETGDDVAAFSAPSVVMRVGAAGRLEFLSRQALPSKHWRIANHYAEVGAEATLAAGEVALGGDYARTRTECRLVGRGSTGDLRAAYFGEGDQMVDFRTFQHHVAPDTSSDLLFKGALADRSRSVYTGLIKVGPEARGTNAFQTNRNIKLSDEAWAESVPNLEIENNDVRCSHASTVSPVDADQLFYLESRGVPPDRAERLIVAGFFDEVVQRLPAPAFRDEVTAALAERVARAEG